MSILNILNRYLDTYATKFIYREVLGYMLPDYRPNYDEVLEQLSKCHYDIDSNRVYDTEFVFDYFHDLNEYSDDDNKFRLRKLLGLSSIEELVDMMDSDSESESEEDIEYNREDLERIEYNYNNDNGMDEDSIDYCC